MVDNRKLQLNRNLEEPTQQEIEEPRQRVAFGIPRTQEQGRRAAGLSVRELKVDR